MMYLYTTLFTVNQFNNYKNWEELWRDVLDRDHHHHQVKEISFGRTVSVHPETCRIYAMAHWSSSASLWWPNVLLIHFSFNLSHAYGLHELHNSKCKTRHQPYLAYSWKQCVYLIISFKFSWNILDLKHLVFNTFPFLLSTFLCSC